MNCSYESVFDFNTLNTKTNCIIEEIRNNTYPPSFDTYTKFYNKTFTGYSNVNCFAYALDVVNANNTNFGSLGKTGRYKNYIECGRRKLIRYLYDSFEEFHLMIRKSSFYDKLERGETKLALGVKPYDFHFIRNNLDGSWSHVRGWGQPPENLTDILTNQELINYIRSELGYIFVGYFAYKKNPKFF